MRVVLRSFPVKLRDIYVELSLNFLFLLATSSFDYGKVAGSNSCPVSIVVTGVKAMKLELECSHSLVTSRVVANDLYFSLLSQIVFVLVKYYLCRAVRRRDTHEAADFALEVELKIFLWNLQGWSVDVDQSRAEVGRPVRRCICPVIMVQGSELSLDAVRDR